MPSVFITGCDRGLGFWLAKTFAQQGWHVFAGSYLSGWPELEHLTSLYPACMHIIPIDITSDEMTRYAAETVGTLTKSLDLLINNAGVSSPSKERTVREGLDYEDLLRLYNVNALGSLRVTYAFLPLLSRGLRKRLCFISSEAGSISRCQRTAWYGYCQSKTALNRAVMHLFHSRRLAGYTFRLFHPGWMRTYMSGARNEGADLDPNEVAVNAYRYFLDEEDNEAVIMRDWQGNRWPW